MSDFATPADAPRDRTGTWRAPGDWADATWLVGEQERIASLRPAGWRPGPGPLRAAGCFVAFARGEEGPGHPGDHAFVGAALLGGDGTLVASVVRHGIADAAYQPGLLALREGRMMLEALHELPPADVVLVDATGRDHPRRAGLALHVGAVLDVPTVGITHRPLTWRAEPPPLARRGDTQPVEIDGEVAAAWVCTATGARPVLAHAAWRTDADTAVAVALRTSRGARTPEPLRVARAAAREARSFAEGRPATAPPR